MKTVEEIMQLLEPLQSPSKSHVIRHIFRLNDRIDTMRRALLLVDDGIRVGGNPDSMRELIKISLDDSLDDSHEDQEAT